MAYTDDYVKTNWVNKPATNTPINQTNLNHLEQGVKNNCGRVANLSTTKAEQSDLLTVFKNVSFDSTTGTFTFTKFDNTTVTINTDLEKLAVNFDYDDDPTSPHYQNLIITLADGTVKYADLSALITQYEFTNSSTISITVSAGGEIVANVIDGSITESKLQPNFLADCQAAKTDAENAANSSESDALKAEGFANGTQNGVPVASGPYYENNAKYWKDQAQQIAGAALGGLSDVTITTPSEGQVLAYDAANGIWRNSSCNDSQSVSGNPLSITTDSAQVARSTKITLSPIQASGTPTPSNPIPIYGYDKVETRVTGKNLIIDKIPNADINENGIIANTSTAEHDTIAPVVSGQTYTFNKDNSTIVYSFFKTLPVVGSTSYNGTRTLVGASELSVTITAPITGYLVVNNKDAVVNEQIELGSTVTAYEPYTEAADISIPLSETVYGGELDVESGVLKVTHRIVDLGDLTWAYNSNYERFTTILTNSNTLYTSLNWVCSCYATSSKAYFDADRTYNVITLDAIGAFIRDNRYTDGASLKTAVTGQKLVYELATPYEIQLTPHQVALLQGANVITSNGTTINITYRTGKVSTLADLEGMAKTINEVADIANGTKSADQITAGTFDGPVKANPTAMANLGTAQVRSIIVTDTAPTVGSSTTIPDGTLIIVYE